MQARWAAMRPLAIKTRPVRSRTPLAPLREALRAGKKAYCSGIIGLRSGSRLRAAAVGHQQGEREHHKGKQKQSRERRGQGELCFQPRVQKSPQGFDAVRQRIEAHDDADPSGGARQRKECARYEPKRDQEKVHDGMEGLGGIHGPRDSEAESGERERNQEYYDGYKKDLKWVEVNAGKWGENQED